MPPARKPVGMYEVQVTTLADRLRIVVPDSIPEGFRNSQLVDRIDSMFRGQILFRMSRRGVPAYESYWQALDRDGSRSDSTAPRLVCLSPG